MALISKKVVSLEQNDGASNSIVSNPADDIHVGPVFKVDEPEILPEVVFEC